ncbi:hypothetical protein GOP47_0014632 [Adiantum capillus-veneris]|uniref:RNA-binding protein 48 n=1 Tax=Adiantum capillus-veneris TaxID=13818 RepID=A0A9D4UME3_ADICA|nr:hypothetical protein GOP47_0014632 [Adiantum capillus-veneris]
MGSREKNVVVDKKLGIVQVVSFVHTFGSSLDERTYKPNGLTWQTRYLIVKNVPALGCIEELVKLFGSYGPIDEYRLMDEEDCEPYTDIYWIKFVKISNARFAKRKLDNFNFLGNLIQVNYAPIYETVEDTKDKLEERRSVLLSRIRSDHQGYLKWNQFQPTPTIPQMEIAKQTIQMPGSELTTIGDFGLHPSPQPAQYFPTASMNATVQAVRQKLNQISQIGENPSATTSSELQQLDRNSSSKELYPSGKKPRVDGRRRI